MNKFLFPVFLACATLTGAAAQEVPLDPKGLGFDPFTPFARLPEAELFPRGGELGVSPDGSLTVNGSPRYLPSVIWYGLTELECREDTPGYVDALRWLYVQMPDYEAMQRIGLDGGGLEAPLSWMNRLYRPWFRDAPRDNTALAPCLTNGLPIYVDFTASEWSHGSLRPEDNPLNPAAPGDPEDGHKTGEPGRMPREAWTVGHHHWVPYSIVEPHGRAIWLNMWTEGARDCLTMTAKRPGSTQEEPVRFRPWCYELMNEPAVFDESEYGKARFAEAMRRKFGDDVPEPGSVRERVEYTKFNEGNFASLLSEGARAIQAIDPEARTCFQPCTIRTRGLDLFRANRDQKVICSPTGGRGIMEAHMLRAMADGKPIVDSEMYVGVSTNSIRNAFLDQYQRGFNASYMFKWSRRPGDWRRVHKVTLTEGPHKGREVWQMWPEETLKHALKPSAYNFMNPYRVHTDALLGIRMAKRDILDVNEFFTPRDRGVPRKVAVLFSSPTERLAQCAGRFGYRLFDQAIAGADFAQLLPDVIFEDQLTNTLERLSRYDVLVAAGVDAVYPGTAQTVRRWVEAGGTLVLQGETMGLDEYGEPAPDAFPGLQTGAERESESETVEVEGVSLTMSIYRDTVVDASWETLAAREGVTLLARKRFGKGVVWFANAKMPSASVGRLLELAGARPVCAVDDALEGGPLSDIEIHPARRGALDAYLITARSQGSRVIRFRPMRPVPCLVRVWNAPAPAAPADAADPRQRDLIAWREPLLPDADGSFVLTLRPGECVAVVGGAPDALEARYPKGEGIRWLPKRTAAQALEEGRSLLAEERAKRIAARPAFDVNPDNTWPLDLRPFVNRRFVDKVAGDGRDGWTDQGAQQCLTDTPWGLTDCNGVRMDFIRYDQNGYRDCLVMASRRLRPAPEGEMPYPERIEGIRVDAQVANLYFLHAIAWGTLGRTDTAMTYIMRYGDGTSLEVPVRAFREVWDWGYVSVTEEMAECDCHRGWANARNQGLYVWRWRNPWPEKRLASIDIVSACGDQIPLVAAITAERPDAARVAVELGEGTRVIGRTGIRAALRQGVVSFTVDERAAGFSGGTLEFPAVSMKDRRFDKLYFQVNKTPDPHGNYHENATPQLALLCRDRNNRWFLTGFQVPTWVRSGQPAYRADNDPETWETACVDIRAYGIDDRATCVYGVVLQFQFPYLAASERSGLAFRSLEFSLRPPSH